MLSIGRSYQATFLGMDIAEYSKLPPEGQLNTKRELMRLVNSACDNALVSEDEREWLDAGDGGYLLVTGAVGLSLDVLEQFCHLHTIHNSRLDESHRFGLRFALHHGSVHIEKMEQIEKAAVGPGINVCARLLDGMSHDFIGQVVASDDYRKLLTEFDSTLDPLFTPLDPIQTKHGELHTVWNVCKVPGFGLAIGEVVTPT